MGKTPIEQEVKVVAPFIFAVGDKVVLFAHARVAYVTGFTGKDLIDVRFRDGAKEEDCFCEQALVAYSDEAFASARAHAVPPLRAKRGGKKRR